MNETLPLTRRRAGRPTKEQAEARFEELLDTALDMFLEHGFELTTIEMIAIGGYYGDPLGPIADEIAFYKDAGLAGIKF